MKLIKDREFGGERPLFETHDTKLENVTIHAGESAIKECSNIVAENCRFEGKYPFWHVKGFKIKNCVFTPGARAALWYCTDCEMTDTQQAAPKMFREIKGLKIKNANMPDAQETLWHCSDIDIEKVTVKNADYIFMHCKNIRINNYKQDGNYSFQYCENVEIHKAVLNSKDCLWNTKNVTVYDSEINGEYIGWYSEDMKFVRCRISGTQPLCYIKNLVLEDCEMAPDCDLAFEDSEVRATIKGNVTSVKNPKTGYIKASRIGEIIIDENLRKPGDCEISQEQIK